MKDYKIFNPKLRQAISAYHSNNTVEYRNKVYNTLPDGPLLVAIDSVPKSYSLNQSTEMEHIFNLLAIEAADGSLILAVFTDEKAVADYVPGHYLLTEPRGLLDIVQNQYHGGIVINPADHGFYINPDDVTAILKNWDTPR